MSFYDIPKLFDTLTPLHRDGSTEKYDPDFLEDVQDVHYTFLHWDMYKACREPDHPYSKVLSQVLASSGEYQGRSWGNAVLRVLKYHEKRPFNTHCDIDYLTYVIGSWGKGFYEGNRYFYGTLAHHIHGIRPTPHKFNPFSAEYSAVVFFIPPFTERLKDGRTVADYYNSFYY